MASGAVHLTGILPPCRLEIVTMIYDIYIEKTFKTVDTGMHVSI